jgi:hypothetical protein
MAIDTTNFIPLVYQGSYTYPDIYSPDKQIKVWLVEEVEYFAIPDKKIMRCMYVDQDGFTKFFGFTEVGMLKCVSTIQYMNVHQHTTCINGRLHIDADKLIDIYDTVRFDWYINERDRRVVEWKTKKELAIAAERKTQEEAAKQKYEEARSLALKSYVDAAKGDKAELSKEQLDHIQNIINFDVTYDYSDDINVWHNGRSRAAYLKQASIDLGFGEGMLKSYCVFYFNYRGVK